MAVSKEGLQEFMRLYEEEFKEQITEDEAREVADRLIGLYELLAEPLPSELAKRRHEAGAETGAYEGGWGPVQSQELP